MVTHDEEFAKKYSDRMIILVDGKVVKDDQLSEVIVKEEKQKSLNQA